MFHILSASSWITTVAAEVLNWAAVSDEFILNEKFSEFSTALSSIMETPVHCRDIVLLNVMTPCVGA